jgi:hypothetical protein
MSTAALQPCCHLRRELANEWSISARLYAEAVVNLTTGNGDGFEKLRLAAREAQARAEASCVLFEEHVASHGC